MIPRPLLFLKKKTIPPILPTFPFLWEKSEPPLFVKFLKTQTPLLYKEGAGRGSNYVDCHITLSEAANIELV